MLIASVPFKAQIYHLGLLFQLQTCLCLCVCWQHILPRLTNSLSLSVHYFTVQPKPAPILSYRQHVILPLRTASVVHSYILSVTTELSPTLR